MSIVSIGMIVVVDVLVLYVCISERTPLPRIINSTRSFPIASAWETANWRRPNGRASICPVGMLSVLLRTLGL